MTNDNDKHFEPTPHILIVDDCSLSTELITDALDQWSYGCSVLNDSTQLFNLLKKEPFDLILMDVNMPVVDGLTLLKQIKASAQTRSVDIIMVIATDDDDTLATCLANGAIDYITKPIRRVTLKAKVAATLDRRATQKALSQSQQQYQAVVESLPAMVCSFTPDHGEITFVNAACCLYFNKSKQELIGKSFLRLIPEEKREAFWQNLGKLDKDNRDLTNEHQFDSSTGRQWQRWIYRALLDKDGNVIGYQSFGIDITELKKAQDQLVQSDKMASIGQLAAGVAHEINNPAGYVSSNLHSLKAIIDDLLNVIKLYRDGEAFLPPPILEKISQHQQSIDLDFLLTDLLELIADSEAGMDRLIGIVKDLKDFSHVGEVQWQQADIHQGFDSTLNIINNELKYKAEVIKNYGDIPSIICIPAQLNQVFLNLMVNAGQAIDDHGRITISTGLLNPDTVFIKIADNGKGIRSDHLGKIFDPFFTTKPVGKGTGLGLSLSYSIIQKHQGTLSVDSDWGKGTTFTITLPLSKQVEAKEGGEVNV